MVEVKHIQSSYRVLGQETVFSDKRRSLKRAYRVLRQASVFSNRRVPCSETSPHRAAKHHLLCSETGSTVLSDKKCGGFVRNLDNLAERYYLNYKN